MLVSKWPLYRQVITGILETLEQYAAPEIQSVQPEFTDPGVNGNERDVTLVLSRPVDETYPVLSNDLATNIQRYLDQLVSVSVTYQYQKQSGKDGVQTTDDSARVYSRRCCARDYDNRSLTKCLVPERSNMVSLRALVVNAIVGLIILFIANILGLGVQISLITLLICAVLGVPGAILVILLAVLNIAFVAAVVPAILV